MSYTMRDWDNTGNEVTKDDFKRIEQGILNNEISVEDMKNETIPDSLANLIKKLNDLNNGVKFYTELSQIDSTFNISTDISTVFDAMQDNSIAMYQIGGSNTNYPATYGQCVITKNTSVRNSAEFADTNGKHYKGAFHPTTFSQNNGFSGWALIPNGNREEVAFVLATGLTAYSTITPTYGCCIEKVSGWATLHCSFTKNSGVFSGGEVIGTIPSGYRPKYDITMLVRAFYVTDVTSQTHDTIHIAQVVVRTTGKVQMYTSNNSGSDISIYKFNRAFITISYPVA